MDDFNDLMSRLSENARFAMQKADYFSKRYNRGYMGTEHLLMGILAQDVSSGAGILRHSGVTLDQVEKAQGKVAVEVPSAQMAMMSLSEATVFTLRLAQNFMRENGLDTIGTEHILYALVSQGNSRAAQLLTKLGVNLDTLNEDITQFVARAARIAAERMVIEKIKGRHRELRWLSRYGTDLTAMAHAGKLDTVIGREKEIERVLTILSRRTKSNPVLIGEAGVGKTAIVEGLAARIAKNDVPGRLIGKRIFQIDLSSIVAGTKFRGEFEERIKGLVDEAVSEPNVILFIDEIHLLTGAGSAEGSMDAANILKPALARGKLHLIGATTLDEYRRCIEKDKALARRFQTVLVEEPSHTVTLRILKGIKKHYEKHHQVRISDEILETAVALSARYLSDRFMPDKAIDVIDEASAIARVALDKKGGSKYKKLKIELASLDEKIAAAAETENYEKAALLKTQAARARRELTKLERVQKDLNQAPAVTSADIATAISLKTGIPVSRVKDSEQELLLKLEKHLARKIIGQDEAIAVVSRAIRRGRAGITDPNRPIGSFVFMGPTGVGKTALARAVAEEVFGGKNSLIKIDMSEFSEKHNVSRLVGAPAGYVGYDDGSKFIERVRRHPYSVVLFDEIEKAHPDVFNILLQILEDGTLTDGQGNKVRFNNTIIILTSNLGTNEMYRDGELGFSAPTKHDALAMQAEHQAHVATAKKALKKMMRPELINRFDAIVTFNALSQKALARIFDLMLDDLKQRLATHSLDVRLTAAAKRHFIKLVQDRKNGARPLRRAIEDELETLLANAILAHQLNPGDVALVDCQKGKLALSLGQE